ncbi:MAG: type IV secretion system DNA-binding domain-containing protein [Christensenellaceae bacterium]|jgi:hypothetical protein|nr:type IV secretion system DNA-binding domain-containing protein [Christensenellaceae bacterium]
MKGEGKNRKYITDGLGQFSIKCYHFISKRELKTKDFFEKCSISKLNNFNDGIVIATAKRMRRIDVTFKKSAEHTCIIEDENNPASNYIETVLNILPHFKTKPSMLVVDSTGDLFKKNYKSLTNAGYKVSVVGPCETQNSICFNPFQAVLDRLDEIRKPMEAFAGGYIVAGKKHKELVEAEAAKIIRLETLWNEIYDYLSDVINTIFSQEHEPDLEFDYISNEIILKLALSIINNIILGKSKPKDLCLSNIYNILNNVENVDGVEALRKHIEEGSSLNIARSSQRLINITGSEIKKQALKLSCFLVDFLSDGYITVDDEIKFSDFEDQPNVIFLTLSGSDVLKKTSSLFLTLAYRSLTDIAESNSWQNLNEGFLVRPFYFILNYLDKQNELLRLEDMISNEQSFKIYFLLSINSLVRLREIYGEQKTQKILERINIKIIKSSLCLKSFLDNTTDVRCELDNTGSRSNFVSSSIEKFFNKNANNALIMASNFNVIKSRFLQCLTAPNIGLSEDEAHKVSVAICKVSEADKTTRLNEQMHIEGDCGISLLDDFDLLVKQLARQTALHLTLIREFFNKTNI